MRLIAEQAAIFSGAFLLFQVQPMMGRFLLPWFGGGPSVWTICLVFFQSLLLAGYAWAHFVAGRLPRVVHWLLLAAAVAAVLRATPEPVSDSRTAIGVLAALGASIGLPYLVLATVSPLIQRFSAAASPYRLYALSNAGSLAGLLSYPFLFEPTMGLSAQWTWWSGTFAVFCGLYAWLAPAVGRVAPEASPGWNWRWLAAPACGSMLLLAVTNQMTQEIPATPFLWVLPLALYLVTFILAFSSARFYQPALFTGLAAAAISVACVIKALGLRAPLGAHIAANSAVLFVCAMICHGELARSRPERAGLTRFYLLLSAGGAFGGSLVALAAPAVFSSFAEFELALAGSCLLPLAGASRSLRRTAILAALIAMASLASEGEGKTLEARRNFFGVLRVSERDGRRSLSHGRVTHGYQLLDPAKRAWPTAYYGPESALGIAMRTLAHPLRAGVIGLGVGTAAAYGQPGDQIRFYEINPAVERLARDYFTYLADSQARVDVVLGDARLELAAQPAQEFDLLAVDAFSSDSVPAHLLTAEAAAVYRRHLKPSGVLLVHVTNQYLDLEPVVRGMAATLGWPAYRLESAADPDRGVSASVWMMVTKDQRLARGGPEGRVLTWTDDRVSLRSILR